MLIDPALFAKAPDPETVELNERILAAAAALPDTWSMPVAEIRRLRGEGRTLLPVSPKSDRAQELLVTNGPRSVPVRLFAPEGPVRGLYLFFHSGGWMFGARDGQDDRLVRFADRTGLVVVAAGYRLAPEHPYPAAPDDCETAALWCLDEYGPAEKIDWFAIGGESAGANLAAVTLLRLVHLYGRSDFRAANLVAGCYDLTLTPSARTFGDARLVLNTRDLGMFVRHYLLHGQDPRDPEISPLTAPLKDMPPALFTVGSKDPLLDDSLFMAMRWAAAGSRAEISFAPGAPHMFHVFDTPAAALAVTRMEAFLQAAREPCTHPVGA